MSKLAVITGGSRGIGKAITETFAKNGFDVAITSRNYNDLKEIKNNLESTYTIKCHIYKADLSKKIEAKGFSEFVQTLNQSISVLVNNTGTFVQGDLMNEPEGVLENLMETNLYSAYHVTRGLISKIKKGHIFNICSIASLKAYPNSGSYSISKFALLGFSKSLREELKNDGIKVTSILPGATYTSSWEGIDLPESRFMKAQDIADTVWATYNLSPSTLIEDIVMRPLEGDI